MDRRPTRFNSLGVSPAGGRIASGHSPFGSYFVEAIKPVTDGVVRDSDGHAVGVVTITFDQPTRNLHRRRSLMPAPASPARRAGLLPPGTWLAMLVQVVTFGWVRPCTSCKSRARAMDRGGWRGLPAWGWRRLAARLGGLA